MTTCVCLEKGTICCGLHNPFSTKPKQADSTPHHNSVVVSDKPTRSQHRKANSSTSVNVANYFDGKEFRSVLSSYNQGAMSESELIKHIKEHSLPDALAGDSIDSPEFRALFRGLIVPDGEIWAPMVAFVNAWAAHRAFKLINQGMK